MTAVLVALITGQAQAWGPRAQRAVMNTALQLLRQQYSQEFFRGTEFLFGEDLLRGALEGSDVLLDMTPRTETDVINAITNQTHLLREVRKYGVGSYFAYRMGMLGAVVADLYLPFALGLEQNPQGQELKRRIDMDIDRRLEAYQFEQQRRGLVYIQTPSNYFGEGREFATSAAELIASDYAVGRGYEGYLAKGGEAFFRKAAHAVADTWHTILRTEQVSEPVRPSQTAVTWYVVDDIGYLLLVKQNLAEAKRAHYLFRSLNTGIVEAYERVGDHFYAFAGTAQREADQETALQLAVDEWRLAAGYSWPERRRVVQKISRYYLEVGKGHLASANIPRGPERALENAIEAFREALGVDRANEEAANLLAEAQIAKKEKDERLRVATEIRATAERTKFEADNLADAGLFEQAIPTYQKAIALCDTVGPEFQALEQAAKDISDDARRGIVNIFEKVIDQAEQAIDDGQALVEDNMFDDGIAKFRSVEGILNIIPGEPKGHYTETKQNLVEQANRRVEEAETARRRWQEEQERLANRPPGTPGAGG